MRRRTDDALAAGCLICHHPQVAVAALYVPAGGGAAVPYSLCRTCWQAFSPTVLAGLVEQMLTERAP